MIEFMFWTKLHNVMDCAEIRSRYVQIEIHGNLNYSR